ncbi:S-adenosyl-L-methionine-dependent methyltransferase [Cubamyces sp. BRFM 1775]|nr:S-adenosyl-L-methionine-dependent methyltransferase [Cubamyces sp. BRFM 1775]
MSQADSSAAHAHPHHDFAEANKVYFNEHAHAVDQEHPNAHKLAAMVIEAMRKAHPALFDKERTEAMDYACGTGLVSLALRPYVKHIVGVDISQASVDIYNKKAAEQGFSSEMEAACALLKGEPEELGGAKFDLITCSASYHHFADIAETTRTLAFFLKPGGSILVADLKAAPDGKELVPSTHHHLVPHKHGFTEEAMRTAFESAGLVEFEMTEMGTYKFNEATPESTWFIARGVKPVEKVEKA